MYKIAAMGDRDSIYGFASLGLSVFPEDDPQSASHKLKKLAEELAERISPEIERFKDSPLPAIIPIPGVAGNTGLGMREVSGYVERAVGSDIVN